MQRRNFIKAVGLASLLPIDQLIALNHFTSDYSIAFGSCNRQSLPQEFWQQILSSKPDIWFGLGDNIYADTTKKKILINKYDQLNNSSFYQQFKKKIPIESIWDDHDYGINNGGKNYKLKEDAQEVFLDFNDVPYDDERRSRQGIYYSKTWTINNKKIKAYFLDCRFFKDKPYKSYSDILGKEQWGWFEDELYLSPGDINIIVSPIGILKNKLHVTEDWDDYKVAKDNLIHLIEKYNPPGLFFLSGDKHFGAFIEDKLKISNEKKNFLEFQSSGLTHGLKKFLIKPINLIYGKSNIIYDRNFAKIDFKIDFSDIRMKWTLYSLDRKNIYRERYFNLNENNQWVRSEIMV